MRPLWIALILSTLYPSADAGKSTYVYLHDRGTPFQVHGFEMLSDGQLEPLSGSPFPGGDDGGECGGLCQTLTYSKSRKALFAAGPSGITVFKVKKSGALKRINGSPFGPGSGEFFGTVTVDSGSKTFVYACENQGDQVRAFKVKSGLGLKDLGGVAETGGGPTGLAVHKAIVVGCSANDQTLCSFKSKKKNGALKETGAPLKLDSGFVFNVQFAPDGDFVYQLDADGDVYGYALDGDTKTLIPLSGNPFPTGLASGNGGLAVAGDFVVAFHFNGTGADDVEVLRRNGDGSLTALTGTQSTGVVSLTIHGIDAKGSRLVVASHLENEVRSYTIDPVSGVLTMVDTEVVDATQLNAAVFVKR